MELYPLMQLHLQGLYKEFIMSKLNQVKAGFVQFDVVFSDIEHNFEEVKKGLACLNKKDAELAVLPEMWSCGFDYKNLDFHAQKTPEILEALCGIAQDYNMVIVGSLPELDGKKIYNTAYVIEKDGSIKDKYRKIHLFTHSGEHTRFESGDQVVVSDTSVGRLGLMICYDLRFPELGRALTDKGADIFVVCGQWPRTRELHWEIFLKARAIEDQLFVIGCNRIGADTKDYGGKSMIISPKGRVLFGAEDSFAVGFAELEFMEMIEYRSQITSLSERRFDIYRGNNNG